jgi:hypothetical protein
VQSERVESWAGLRSERAPEILSQVDLPFGYWASVAGLSPATTPFTLELVTLAMQFSAVVVQRMKYDLVVPRPAEFSGRIQPMIDTPAFFALPSGHATQSYCVAAVLMRLLAQRATPQPTEGLAQIGRLAERIATNRVVAGLHFPVDNVTGLALGVSLGEYLAHRGCGSALSRRTFRAVKYHDADFEPRIQQTSSGPLDIGHDSVETTTADVRAAGNAYVIGKRVATDTALSWLWHRASDEWYRDDIYGA